MRRKVEPKKHHTSVKSIHCCFRSLSRHLYLLWLFCIFLWTFSVFYLFHLSGSLECLFCYSHFSIFSLWLLSNSFYYGRYTVLWSFSFCGPFYLFLFIFCIFVVLFHLCCHFICPYGNSAFLLHKFFVVNLPKFVIIWCLFVLWSFFAFLWSFFISVF